MIYVSLKWLFLWCVSIADFQNVFVYIFSALKRFFFHSLAQFLEFFQLICVFMRAFSPFNICIYRYVYKSSTIFFDTNYFDLDFMWRVHCFENWRKKKHCSQLIFNQSIQKRTQQNAKQNFDSSSYVKWIVFVCFWLLMECLSIFICFISYFQRSNFSQVCVFKVTVAVSIHIFIDSVWYAVCQWHTDEYKLCSIVRIIAKEYNVSTTIETYLERPTFNMNGAFTIYDRKGKTHHESIWYIIRIWAICCFFIHFTRHWALFWCDWAPIEQQCVCMSYVHIFLLQSGITVPFSVSH